LGLELRVICVSCGVLWVSSFGFRVLCQDYKQPSDDSIATRQSLLYRLRNSADETSWREFFDTYWNLIYRVARKAGLSDAEAQDVVQETVISVAQRIEGFVYDPQVCSFRSTICACTNRSRLGKSPALWRSAWRGFTWLVTG
jgi:hypothetical protein